MSLRFEKNWKWSKQTSLQILCGESPCRRTTHGYIYFVSRTSLDFAPGGGGGFINSCPKMYIFLGGGILILVLLANVINKVIKCRKLVTFLFASSLAKYITSPSFSISRFWVPVFQVPTSPISRPRVPDITSPQVHYLRPDATPRPTSPNTRPHVAVPLLVTAIFSAKNKLGLQMYSSSGGSSYRGRLNIQFAMLIH